MFSLESNQITELHDFPFVSVKEIFLSHNLIEDISCMSGHIYTNLKMLVVFNCKVSKLPKLDAPCV